LDQEREFIDGEDLSKTRAFKEYRLNLESFLKIPDSMQRINQGPILPPNIDSMYWKSEAIVENGEKELRIVSDGGQKVYFRNLTKVDKKDNIIKYEFKAYDSKYRIAYIMESREYGYFRIFGVSLNTGNQFNVYINSNARMYDKMYTWNFSPDFNYLLKTGDLDDGMYGWSIINLEDGIEGKIKFKRYQEFITKPKWIDNKTFGYTYFEIPFKNKIYNKDYAYFYSLMNRNPLPEVELNKQNLYPVEYIIDTKGRILSEKLYEYRIGE
jgi:hypothetical protein